MKFLRVALRVIQEQTFLPVSYTHLDVYKRQKVALKYRDYETAQWIPISWNQFSGTVRQAANAFVALGAVSYTHLGVSALHALNQPNITGCLVSLYSLKSAR